MGKNNFIFVYLDPPKSREERRREKEAARQRKLQKKKERELKEENNRIKDILLTCKEIIWLLEHKESKGLSPQQIYFIVTLLSSLLGCWLLYTFATTRKNVLMFIVSIALICIAQPSGFGVSPYFIHKNAKKIIKEGRAQEYINDYISKYGEIK